METGLSSPAHREDEPERLPDREAHLIIELVPAKGNIKKRLCLQTNPTYSEN